MIDQQRFGRIVLARREELGLSQRDAWKEGGPSGPVWTEIENAVGPVPQQRTLAKLDKALRWEPGSAKRTLEGGGPTPLEPIGDEPEIPLEHKHVYAEFSILAIAKAKQGQGVELSSIERRALQVELEERQLGTFRERFEMLSHDSKVEVSYMVDELLDQEAKQWIDRFGLPPPKKETKMMRQRVG